MVMGNAQELEVNTRTRGLVGKPISLGCIFVGGGGGHIGNDFAPLKASNTFERVNLDLIAINTDIGDLGMLDKAIDIIQIGPIAAGGGGAGTDPLRGAEAARESMDDIQKVIEEHDFLIFFGCLGGGTGSGALPEILEKYCEITKDQKNNPLPTQKTAIAIVTMPWLKEGAEAQDIANESLRALKAMGVPIVRIKNDKLSAQGSGTNRSWTEMYSAANKPLVQLISRIIRALGKPHNRRNIDRNDIVSNMNAEIRDSNQQLLTDAHVAVGYGSGENAVADALQEIAENSFTDTSIGNCKRLIMSVDATTLSEQDWDKVLAFMAQHKIHEDSSWRYGISEDYEAMEFEADMNASVAISVIGLGHCPGSISAPTLSELGVLPLEISVENTGAHNHPVLPLAAGVRKIEGDELANVYNMTKGDNLPTHRGAETPVFNGTMGEHSK